MRTIYIDVYFLINFTVDMLSLYFAAIFAKVPTSTLRLIVSSATGAFLACLVLFINDIVWLKLIFSALVLVIMAIIGTKKIRFARRIKFMIAFLIFSALVGGAVYFLWGIFDKYLYDSISPATGGSVNRKMLMLAIIVLLSIGVFKMLVAMFSAKESERSVILEINFVGKSIRTEAFVDSGNLAIDPMDMRPVMLIKKKLAEKILPSSVISITDPDLIEREVRRRIRLVPISRGGETHILTGIKPDSVKLIFGEVCEEISVTVAIDKEGGSFGGYEALLPSASLEHV